jgi:hypothetical protein
MTETHPENRRIDGDEDHPVGTTISSVSDEYEPLARHVDA